MKHPDAQQWMSFLYDEVSADDSSRLRAHLEGCAECSAKINAWRGGMKSLDEWRLPAAGRKRHPWQPLFRGPAAAAILLGLGVALGRFTSPSSNDLRGWKAKLEADIQQKLEFARAQLSDEFKQIGRTSCRE